MTMRTRTRTLLATAAAGTTMMLTAGVASAVPPVVTPPAGEYTVHIPAEGTPCGAFTVDVHDGERFTTFVAQNGTVRYIGINGTLRMHVTSDITGHSIDLNVPGPAKVFPNGNAVFTGAMFLFGPNTFAFIHGRAFLPGLNVDQAVVTGKRVDLCPILVG